MSHQFIGHDAIIAEMLRTLPPGSGIQIPPPAFAVFGTELMEYAPGNVIKASFTAAPSFANPMGTYLGAAIGAAMDMLFGSMSYLETRLPCTTVTMEMTFVRPIIADGKRYRCEVSLRAKTKRFVFLEGRAFSHENKLAMTATTTMVLL